MPIRYHCGRTSGACGHRWWGNTVLARVAEPENIWTPLCHAVSCNNCPTNKRGRGIQTVFGCLVAPDVVDTILGMEGTAHERFVIFEEFEKKLVEETGLSRDRFISIDIGPIMGHHRYKE
jgi:hypothetical protein